MNRSRVLTGSLSFVALVFAVAPSLAHNSYLTAFQNRYPTSTLSARMQARTGSSCNVCHHPGDTGNSGNCYKESLVSRLNAGRTISQALADVENLDSDNDGESNLVEILAPREGQPGQVGYSPGLVGATGTDPCGAPGNLTGQLETPPTGPTCDSIDFNNDTSFFDPQDIDAFLSVYSEGPCVPATATCNDIDFNNDTSVFDPCDITSFLIMYSEGPCTLCG